MKTRLVCGHCMWQGEEGQFHPFKDPETAKKINHRAVGHCWNCGDGILYRYEVKTYEVEIQAIYTRTIRVEATDEEEAEDYATMEFEAHGVKVDENYQESVLRIEELTSDPE